MGLKLVSSIPINLSLQLACLFAYIFGDKMQKTLSRGEFFVIFQNAMQAAYS
jgi:hypothetical protein